MAVEKSNKFDKDLESILDRIALDSLYAALNLVDELEKRLKTLPHMPYKFRKSIYFDDDNIRDYIYKGYVIPYLIDTEEDKIILLGMVKYREHL